MELVGKQMSVDREELYMWRKGVGIGLDVVLAKFGGSRQIAVRTFRLTFPLPQRPKPCSSKRKKGRKTFRNPIIFAREWQELRASKGWSQVDLAHHLGVTEARVSQVFSLLKLAPEAQEILVELGDNLTYVVITERDLRVQLKFSEAEQVANILHLLASAKPSRHTKRLGSDNIVDGTLVASPSPGASEHQYARGNSF